LIQSVKKNSKAYYMSVYECVKEPEIVI